MSDQDSQKITITVGRALFRFTSMDDWINWAPRRFRNHGVENDDVLCVDQRGFVCRDGAGFMRAAAAGAFPVVVYVCRPDHPTGEPHEHQ